MIVSRTAELQRLDRLVAGLPAGHGGALVLHGEAGIGKTTLLDLLVERAGDGVAALRASGVESEAELAFSTLADLLTPRARRTRRAAGRAARGARSGARPRAAGAG